jgi:excisionase family DNA binding protein
MDILPENLSIGETVRQLGIGRTTLYELIRRGDIEAIKLGRRTLVRADSARAFIDNLPRIGGRA